MLDAKATGLYYLGFIEDGTVMPSDKKINAIKYFPIPSNQAIQSFLELTGYFRKLIPKYASIVPLLRNLLKNKTKLF